MTLDGVDRPGLDLTDIDEGLFPIIDVGPVLEPVLEALLGPNLVVAAALVSRLDRTDIVLNDDGTFFTPPLVDDLLDLLSVGLTPASVWSLVFFVIAKHAIKRIARIMTIMTIIMMIIHGKSSSSPSVSSSFFPGSSVSSLLSVFASDGLAVFC